jgi:hypothetical protein
MASKVKEISKVENVTQFMKRPTLLLHQHRDFKQ